MPDPPVLRYLTPHRQLLSGKPAQQPILESEIKVMTTSMGSERITLEKVVRSNNATGDANEPSRGRNAHVICRTATTH